LLAGIAIMSRVEDPAPDDPAHGDADRTARGPDNAPGAHKPL